MADKPNMDWTAEGLCSGVLPPDPWYVPEKYEVGKAICRQCPVQTECLDYALWNRERFGVWGGVDENERLRMVRRSIRRGTPLPRNADKARRRDPARP